jgi:hypothetical protein
MSAGLEAGSVVLVYGGELGAAMFSSDSMLRLVGSRKEIRRPHWQVAGAQDNRLNCAGTAVK